MDDVRCKGQGQISRYVSSNAGIKSVIEKQLGNVQSSYNALLNTALQIKVFPFKLQEKKQSQLTLYNYEKLATLERIAHQVPRIRGHN